MKDEDEKKGFFSRLTGSNKTKKDSCCCNFEIEEVTDGKENDQNKAKEDEGNSCCNK
ncbi:MULTISPECIES: hypothetical protein [unclassified Dehalobacter]|jgi:hypothetical protein|uniref:hypothetical protein n=1 Tax=unclassified Dehalobacter TaxID=2635733 RepID=UPI00143B3E62|nr:MULTISPECIES: hypothetical protein [unclassified Dehalobacter]